MQLPNVIIVYKLYYCKAIAHRDSLLNYPCPLYIARWFYPICLTLSESCLLNCKDHSDDHWGVWLWKHFWPNQWQQEHGNLLPRSSLPPLDHLSHCHAHPCDQLAGEKVGVLRKISFFIRSLLRAVCIYLLTIPQFIVVWCSLLFSAQQQQQMCIPLLIC